MREPESWRQTAAQKVKVPLWTVDADVNVPSKLLEKAQFAAHIIRPRLEAQLKTFLVSSGNPRARVPWKKPKALASLDPDVDIIQGWKLDCLVAPVLAWRGGTQGSSPVAKRVCCTQTAWLRHPAQHARE